MYLFYYFLFVIPVPSFSFSFFFSPLLGIYVHVEVFECEKVFTGEIEPTKTPTPLGQSHSTLLAEAPMLVSSLLKVFTCKKNIYII
jgi:hypothetical protein